ncbi:S41 family peptidase [Aquimarina celericrescens]|uniref:S41 family peptidase n=1 Tax=Aquimarina celericrescens TaxID=1964542 RepID=A0ABW5B013_9FLAO|nr:peptidase S41 [Aquimarina celericrescens]
MKKEILKLGILLLSFLFIVACSSDDDIQIPDPGSTPVTINNPDEEIDDFVWKAMNFWYLYKPDVTDLQDSKLDNVDTYRRFLNSYDAPENLFDALLTKRTLQGLPEDQFSFVVNDYIALEQEFSGVSKSNGMEFQLGRIGDSNDLFGFVTYVLPGTDAEAKGVIRGDIFTTINGTQLTVSNYVDFLFNTDGYDIGFNTIENNTLVPAKTLTLNKTEYTENPIFMSKTIEYKGEKVGYMLYNSFTFGFNKELNDAFAAFKNDQISHLILDLRYNGGGSVYTATALASMITGGYTGEVFAKSIYNPDVQAIVNNQSNADSFLNDRFLDNVIVDFENNIEEPINSLGLQKLYVLATRSSASASELVINGLTSYIDVIHIGAQTRGKYQASRTLYDSEDLGREGVNQNHTYALQPLVSKVSNKDGNTDYITGFTPLVPFDEDFQNLGVIGETSEPFLNAALEYIVNNSIPAVRSKEGFMKFEMVGESKMNRRSYQKMYLDRPLKGLTLK